MNKKIKVIIIGSVILILASVIFSNIIKNNESNAKNIKKTNNSNKTILKEEEIQVEPEAREKSNYGLIEDTIRNFRDIYVSLINDKELDFSFLNNVVTKDSDIYKEIVKDIETKRNSNTKLEEQNVDIKEIKDLAEGYEVIATITYTETTEVNSKDVKLEKIFKVSVKDNNIKIIGFN